MIPLFVAYFTIGTQYEREARGFRESLDALGLAHDIIGVPDLGNWQANTSYKPRFVQDMRNKHRGGPVVYCDVDAFVLHQPTALAAMDCDIAAPIFAGHTLLSGTVYFSGTAKTTELVDRWAALCRTYPSVIPSGVHPKFKSGCDAWDQRLLDLAILQTPGVRFTELPPEYGFMIGLSQRQYPDRHPVILHTHGHLRCTDEC